MLKKIALLSVMAIVSVNANVELVEQAVAATMAEVGCSDAEIKTALNNSEVKKEIEAFSAEIALFQDPKNDKIAKYALVGVAAAAVVGGLVWKFDLIGKAKVKMFGTLEEQLEKAKAAAKEADNKVASAKDDKAKEAAEKAAKNAAEKVAKLEKQIAEKAAAEDKKSDKKDEKKDEEKKA